MRQGGHGPPPPHRPEKIMSTGLHGLGILVTAAQFGYFAAVRLPAGPDPAANGGLG
jgi:hypothetical protein